MERRDAPDPSGRLVSFSGERGGSGVLLQSSWCVYCRYVYTEITKVTSSASQGIGLKRMGDFHMQLNLLFMVPLFVYNK